MKWCALLIALTCMGACGSAYSDYVPGAGNPFRWQQFMPDNTLSRFDNINKTNITESEFNGILDTIEQVYRPIFANFGANFVLERAWADSTVNAYAEQQGKDWIVHMYGGMARRAELNTAGFGLVACHEIGHHLAGFPFYNGNDWAANEGQSDYFANFVCAPKVFGGLPVPAMTGIGKQKCDEAWPNSQQAKNTCYIGLDGGLRLGKLLAALGGEATPKFETPDQSKVTKTSDSHPRAQCRVDTYLAGASCVKQWNDGVIPRADGAVCNNRPRCWFYSAGSPDPDPNPDPNPNPDPSDGQSDKESADMINYYRDLIGLGQLIENSNLLCAAQKHVDDIGPAGKCSQIGTDNSNNKTRLKACGYNGNATQLLACRFPDGETAAKAWLKDRANRAVIDRPTWGAIACATNNGYFACILGN
jgi:hypothetical protein